MSTGLETIRERMADYLREQGVAARCAWSDEERADVTGPVVAVSLRGCQAGMTGFQDYLGERYNPETGLWEELYGRKARLTFGLDLYAPARCGEGEMQAAFDKLAAALTQGGPEGLKVQEYSCAESEYDSRARLRKRTVEAVCGAYLCAVAQPGDVFLDFELRGGLKQ